MTHDIHPDVYMFGEIAPQHQPILKAFFEEFRLTWARHYEKYGSEFTAYFIKPNRTVANSIGIDREIALIVCDYPTIRASTWQAASAFLNEPPAAGRVEPLAYALAAPVEGLASEVNDYLSGNRESRLVVPFTWSELQGASPWFIRSRFLNSLSAHDMFDMRQPLITDNYYFGRKQLVTDLLDRMRNGENAGLFGLRKTGKTSAVFKLRRLIRNSSVGTSIYIDAQTPKYHSLRWWQLLEAIARDLAKETGINPSKEMPTDYNEQTAADSFDRFIAFVLANLPDRQRRILLIVDEIEHIVPELGPAQSVHWKSDFIPFWKTLRAVQTEHSGLTFLVVGVNSACVERVSIERQDNPLFSLVGDMYMPSLDRSEVREMVRTIGRPMGIKFKEDAYAYLTDRYGGHPTLIRQACSWHHKRAVDLRTERPFTLSTEDLRQTEDQCELGLMLHIKHSVEVLRDWYDLEFEMLKMLAQDNVGDFVSLASDMPELKRHLENYGLVGWQDGVPYLRIAAVGKFLRPSLKNRRLGDEGGTETDWLTLVTEISRLRNILEPKLRRYIKRTLKAHNGADRWIHPVLEALPSSMREQLQGVDADEILSNRLYLLNLVAVLEKNWKYFESLGRSSRHRLDKNQISVLLNYVNNHREDAHAKEVDVSQVAVLAAVCSTLNAALDEQLED